MADMVEMKVERGGEERDAKIFQRVLNMFSSIFHPFILFSISKFS